MKKHIQQIQELIASVNANQYQCKFLYSRISSFPLDSIQPRLKKVKQQFRELTDDVLTFMKTLAANDWHQLIIKHGTLKEKFDDFHVRLVSLADQCNEKFQREEPKEQNARDEDRKDLIGRVDRIAELLCAQRDAQIARLQVPQDSQLDSALSERPRIMASCQYHLNQMLMQRDAEQKHQDFLHIPYYDLYLICILGTGGFANCYLAIWLSRQETVAVKIIQPQQGQWSNNLQQDCIKEIAYMSSIRYQHVVNVLGEHLSSLFQSNIKSSCTHICIGIMITLFV